MWVACGLLLKLCHWQETLCRFIDICWGKLGYCFVWVWLCYWFGKAQCDWTIIIPKKKRDQGHLKTRCPCQIIFSSIIIPPHDLWFHIKIDLNLSPVVICYQSCYQSETRGFNALCLRNRYWTTNSLLCDSAWQRCMNVSVLSIHRKRSVSCIHKTNPSEKINK